MTDEQRVSTTTRNEAAERLREAMRQLMRPESDKALILIHSLDAALATERRLTVERIEAVAEMLEAWGSAIRGDWSEIDGRTIRDTMRGISAYLRGERDDDPLLMVVCRAGILGAHWFGTNLEHDCTDLLDKLGEQRP